MKRNRHFCLLAVTVAMMVPQLGQAQQILTGDTRLACEAILCLATAKPPTECSAALTRYFGISLRHLRDTARARANFLKLCPRVDERKQLTAQFSKQREQTEARGDGLMDPKTTPNAVVDPAR